VWEGRTSREEKKKSKEDRQEGDTRISFSPAVPRAQNVSSTEIGVFHRGEKDIGRGVGGDKKDCETDSEARHPSPQADAVVGSFAEENRDVS